MPAVRILAFADLHGRTERVTRVRALVAEHAPDLVVLSGDLTHVDKGAEALSLLHTLPVPVLAVPGNMDGPGAVDEITRHGGLAGEIPKAIAGFSFGGPDVQAACDVIVTHEPPLGTLDLTFLRTRAGSRMVLELLTRHRPRVLVCGHIHEAPGVARLEETLVVNCSMGNGKNAGALIELSEEGTDARLLGDSG
ncbi:MAG: metallophosphoesterase family protein [bacterium]|nr:metallophosphoesterase family protein [bacterium]